MSTWTGGVAPPACQAFFEGLSGAGPGARRAIGACKFAIYALGDSVYSKEGHFCKAARDLEATLTSFGCARLCEGVEEDASDRKEEFGKWKDLVWVSMGARVLGNSVVFADHSDSESEGSDCGSHVSRTDDEEDEDGGEGGGKGEGVLDIEDVGKVNQIKMTC